MRIIAGKLKGTNLHLSKDKKTRPLKDLVRESIFNLLTHSNTTFCELEKSEILDLYSGTGSFGLECLSRQAKFVYFVESEKAAFEILEKNIKKLKIKKSKAFFCDVFDLIEKQHLSLPKFDLIFCDPPFKDRKVQKLVNLIFNKNLLKKNGIILFHRKKDVQEIFPNFFKIVDERIYGISKIIFGKFL